jgi:predicted RNA-binding protein with PUA-like domain
VQRTGAKRPTQPLPGLGESEYQQWPEKIKAHCEWSEGSVTLGMRLTYWSIGDQRHGGELVTDIEIVDSDISLLWVTLADPFIKEKFLDGQVQLPARVGFVRRKKFESAETCAGYNQALQALIPESEYPRINKRTFSFGTASAATGTPFPNGRTIFEHAIFLALLKAPFLLRGKRTGRAVETLIDIEGLSSATTNHSAPTPKNADKLTQWERAYWILFDANKPLATQQILDEIKSRGWPKVGGKPNNTIWTRLYEHSHNNGKSQSSHFENLGKNHWVLTKWGRANPPCPRPAFGPTTVDASLRRALGMDRLMGLTPLPGGIDQYKQTLDFVLTALSETAMGKEDLAGFINQHFGPLSPQYTRQNIRLLSHLDLIHQNDETVLLSKQGATYLSDPSTEAFFKMFDQSYSGVLATLVFAERAELLTTRKAHQYINRCLQKDWQTQAQSNRRLRWLHSAGALDKTSKRFTLTDTGKAILEERRADADIILRHLDQTADVEHALPTCWIFQANPTRWDARTALSELSETDFEVNQHKDKIKAGHKVFFWISGKGGGVFAIGTVLNDPTQTEAPASQYDTQGWTGTKGKLRTQVRIDHCLDEPISRDEVKACEGLESLQILKMSQGSNFKVTTDQAEVLAELYEEHGGELWDEQHHETPSDAEDFTFSRTEWSTELREACATWGLPHVTNLVLEGVPGTGKTFAIKQITKHDENKVLKGRGEGRHAITLHPATSYEDFVEGLRPGAQLSVKVQPWWNQVPVPYRQVEVSGFGEANWFFNTGAKSTDQSSFTIHDGFFLRVCREAVHFPHKDFLVLLDEINRCNVPKVLGDLLTTLERSKRAQWAGEHWDLSQAQVVTLPYSKRAFFVPDNVFVVATMNTTDRSVAPLDAALRRRFGFCRVWPLGFDNPKMLERKESPEKVLQSLRTGTDLYKRRGQGKAGKRSANNAQEAYAVVQADLLKSIGGKSLNSTAEDCLARSIASWVALNTALLVDLGPDAMLGHSYLFDLVGDLAAKPDDRRWRGEKESATNITSRHWSRHLLPQLAEVLVSNNRIELAAASTGKSDSCLQTILKDLRQKNGGLWGDCFHSTVEGEGLNKMPVFDLNIDTLPDVNAAKLDTEKVDEDFEGIEE